MRTEWWVLRPTLSTELRFLFLTKHGVPLRLILLLAPALQHLTRPYACLPPLARQLRQDAHSPSAPHRRSFRGTMQADASIELRGTDIGPVLDRHPVLTPRYGVLRRLLVLWTLTQAVADATGLRPSENTVMASLTSVNADSHSASTYSFARKRSYKRAVRRAAQSEGQHTQYRGRVCTLQQLCRGYRGRQPQQGPSRRSHQPFLQLRIGCLC